MTSYLGIDFGTSGARAIVINTDRAIQFETQYSFTQLTDADLASCWQTALFALIDRLPQELKPQINAIAINGTSSTVLLCDETGKPVDAPILYNDARGVEAIAILKTVAPPNHTVLSATSSLAKLMWWMEKGREDGVGAGFAAIKPALFHRAEGENYYFLHQADWLGFLLHGQLGISDYHNALKLGYDVDRLCYPEWLEKLLMPSPRPSGHPSPIGRGDGGEDNPGDARQISYQLPQVVAPGTAIAPVTVEISDRFGLKPDCTVCAGTTDSIAAFLASGAEFPGEAVTSLGSTLVLKLLSPTRIDDPQYGIYSHRLGNLWLVGGASNTGGAVLRQFFTDDELESLSSQIDPRRESSLDYYPLLTAGDRFPINDPNLLPRLEPRPSDRVEFLHGLLESIARIEARGYRLLQQLGATPLTRVYTAGGGAKNSVWTKIRSRHLQVAIAPPVNTAAAYGTALLAMSGFR
ncbi:MAG: FGGY-family carbohydrate kinase [Cyanosarcina radialis HA8281-LM2]|jgi:sugar (pentulose or hexulose) kinase|nr:FGGY-family carbohydrate kinase [Cyanosarcina radialis HA8281-LM2]